MARTWYSLKSPPITTTLATPVSTEKITASSSNKFFSPLVRSIAEKEGISIAELEGINGTGAEGRVTKKDILNTTLKEAIVEKEEIIKETKEQARTIISKANAEVEKDKLRVQNELSGEVMDLVSLVAEKFVAERLSKEDEDKMIKDAIAKVSNGK